VQAAPPGDLDTDYTPRYIFLARLLRGQIEDGTYPPGSLLPSSKRLASEHEVTRNGAARARDACAKRPRAPHRVKAPSGHLAGQPAMIAP